MAKRRAMTRALAGAGAGAMGTVSDLLRMSAYDQMTRERQEALRELITKAQEDAARLSAEEQMKRDLARDITDPSRDPQAVGRIAGSLGYSGLLAGLPTSEESEAALMREIGGKDLPGLAGFEAQLPSLMRAKGMPSEPMTYDPAMAVDEIQPRLTAALASRLSGLRAQAPRERVESVSPQTGLGQASYLTEEEQAGLGTLPTAPTAAQSAAFTTEVGRATLPYEVDKAGQIAEAQARVMARFRETFQGTTPAERRQAQTIAFALQRLGDITTPPAEKQRFLQFLQMLMPQLTEELNLIGSAAPGAAGDYDWEIGPGGVPIKVPKR